MSRILTILCCGLLTGMLISQAQADESFRIWVDVSGQFAVKAELVKVNTDSVTLLRNDGNEITIPLDRLSQRDQEYVEKYEEAMVRNINPLRMGAPEARQFKPQPLLNLPTATHVEPNGAALRFKPSSSLPRVAETPGELPADAVPWRLNFTAVRMQVSPVDVNDTCSRPIPILRPNGPPMVVVSVSRRSSFEGEPTRNQLIRFDDGESRAKVALDHRESILMLDHHQPSGRSLLLVGFNSLGQGGELAIATGWHRDRVRISLRRALTSGDDVASVPHVRWARLIDEEHIVAAVDQTLGMWNLVSGEQVYAFGGVDHRAEPVVSPGGRYVAVPYYGKVQLYESATGKPLGRIDVEKQVPGVSFDSSGSQLAIATTRHLRVWDLPNARLSADVPSRRSLGTKRPTWVDSDLVLTSSGVLLSVYRGLPLWRYDIAAAQAVSLGDHVAIFRKHPVTELTIHSLPHDGAVEAMSWFDRNPVKADESDWRILGRSVWNSEGWTDRDLQISAGARKLR